MQKVNENTPKKDLTEAKERIKAIKYAQLHNKRELEDDLITMFTDSMTSYQDYDLDSRQRLATTFGVIHQLVQKI